MRKIITILTIIALPIVGIWLLQNSFYQIVQAAPLMLEQSATPTNNPPPNGLTAAEWGSIQTQIAANASTNIPWLQQAKLTASNGAELDLFGYSVAVSGDTVVVGIRSGLISDSVYVFTKPQGGWSTMTQTAKLTTSDGAAVDFFGSSVAISGDTIVVGAYGDDDNGDSSGSAYVFVKPAGGWSDMTQTAKLTAADGAADDWFGNSVDISGDTIVVGAFLDDNNGFDFGSAYVFVKPTIGGWTNMTQTAKLTASDGAVEDYFGYSVAISGDTVVIGAYADDDNGFNSGSAYVFVKPTIGGWSDMTQTAKLTAADGAVYDSFGYSVAVNGDTVVVGADADNDNGSNSGSAYVFVKPGGGWSDMTQTAKLTAADGVAEDWFGNSVAISGDTVVVGAFWDDDNGEYSGSAYVFIKPGGGWSDMTQTAKLTAADGASYDEFGYSVAVSGDTIVIGADRDADNGTASGSAYVFEAFASQIISTVIDSGGGIFTPTNTLTYTFPAGAFSEPVTVTYTTLPSVTSSLPDMGIFYELTAVYTSNGQPAPLEAGKTFTTLIQYDEANLPAGVSEESLKLFYQTSGAASVQSNAATTAWEPAASSVVDTVQNEITAVDSRLGTWAVFSAGYEIYLPVVVKP